MLQILKKTWTVRAPGGLGSQSIYFQVTLSFTHNKLFIYARAVYSDKTQAIHPSIHSPVKAFKANTKYVKYVGNLV